MFAVILKKILSFAELEIHIHSGDVAIVRLKIGEKVVFDRAIDFIRGA